MAKPHVDYSIRKPNIVAGDTVTYQLTYTLASSADYGNLSLTSFLPLPVFSATDPLATGGTEAFTAGSTGLVAGTYYATRKREKFTKVETTEMTVDQLISADILDFENPDVRTQKGYRETSKQWE